MAVGGWGVEPRGGGPPGPAIGRDAPRHSSRILPRVPAAIPTVQAGADGPPPHPLTNEPTGAAACALGDRGGIFRMPRPPALLASIRRAPVDHSAEPGPFDIVGDVHGCLDELCLLLGQLGYEVVDGLVRRVPPGRRLVFVGDFWDRGPAPAACLRLVIDACRAGLAFAVPGNRDVKLARLVEERRTRSAEECELLCRSTNRAGREEIARFIASLPGHLVLDGGRLVVAHAGLPADKHGDDSKQAWKRAVFGSATGPPDADGLPQRLGWTRRYRGESAVVFGHTPLVRPVNIGRTWGIDTGCVYGGSLTALRYPEFETVSVPAVASHARRLRPLAAPRVG